MPYHVVFDIESDIERAAIFELEKSDETSLGRYINKTCVFEPYNIFSLKRVAWVGKDIDKTNIFSSFRIIDYSNPDIVPPAHFISYRDGFLLGNTNGAIAIKDELLFNTFEEAKSYLKSHYVELMIDEQDYLLFEVVKTQRRLQENFIKFTEIVPRLDQIIMENEKK